MKILIGTLYLYLIWFTAEVYKGAQNQRMMIELINSQQAQIGKLSSTLNDMEFAIKNASNKIVEYCEDKGGEPFLTSTGNYMIVKCKEDNSLKFFINLAK